MSTRVLAVPAPAARWSAAGLVVAVVASLVPTVVHGNPPIESAELTLRWVAERPSWRLLHLLAIAGVLTWAAALAAVARGAPDGPGREAGRVARLAMTVAAAVFAVYFGLHATLAMPAEQLVTGAVPTELLIERAAAMIMVLGAVAFTAQALLGAAIALHGLALVLDARFGRWIGVLGLVAGLGWLVGALIVNFAVIVPFMLLAWLWALALAVVLLRGLSPRGRTPGMISDHVRAAGSGVHADRERAPRPAGDHR